jgi:hypothetical protein
MLKNLRHMGVDRPLPQGLRSRLLAIPEEDSRDWGAVPQAPLPETLRQRLVQIPKSSSRPASPPEWLLSTRYAAAASLLLATLTFSAFGNPVTRGQEAAGALGQRIQNAVSEVRSQGESTLAATENALRGSYQSTRKSVMTSVTALSNRWHEVADTVEEWTHIGSASSDADPSSVSSQEEDKEKEDGRTENRDGS